MHLMDKVASLKSKIDYSKEFNEEIHMQDIQNRGALYDINWNDLWVSYSGQSKTSAACDLNYCIASAN